MKFFRFLLYALLTLGALFLLFFKPTPAATPYAQTDYYQSTIHRLDSTFTATPTRSPDTLYVGWARQNVTPRPADQTDGLRLER